MDKEIREENVDKLREFKRELGEGGWEILSIPRNTELLFDNLFGKIFNKT